MNIGLKCNFREDQLKVTLFEINLKEKVQKFCDYRFSNIQ